MTTIKSWLWLLLPLFFIALIIHTPARLIQWLLPEQLTLQSSYYQGSLWDGSANQVVVGANGTYMAVDTLNWQFKPFSLLLFSPAVEVQLQVQQQDYQSQELKGIVQWLGDKRWQITNLEANIPAEAAGYFVGGMPVSGQLSLRLNELQAKGDRIEQVDGNISWQNARWNNGDRWFDFGSVVGELSVQGNDILVKLFDLSGPLEIDAELLMEPNGAIDIKGIVVLRPQAPKEFSQALSLFAEQQANGKYKIDFQY